jgi:hypothetical protein
MPLSPPKVLEAGSGTKFQLLPLFNIVGPFLGLTRNLGAHQLDLDETRNQILESNVVFIWGFGLARYVIFISLFLSSQYNKKNF